MYQVKVNEKRIKLFMREEDYLNYLDYMENGLKMIHTNGARGFVFNDGSRLTDVSFNNEFPRRYVLHKDTKTFKDAKFIKKYVELAEQWKEAQR